MDDDEYEDVTPEPIEPHPWSWPDFWSIITAGVGAYFALIGAMVVDISNLIEGHGKYQRSRKEMAEQGAREIEALIAVAEKERAEITT